MSSLPGAGEGLLSASPARSTLGLPVQLVWLVAAFVSSLCGIGGGLFAVPILHYLGGLSLKRSVATSLCLVFLLSLTATSVEVFHSGSALRPSVVATLVGGGYFGARAGMRVADRINVNALKVLFAIVLALAAARVFALEALIDTSAGSGVEVTTATVAIVLAVGFGGGFVAPLLGVGGGLLVIPALFLSLPSITYLEARACSMAMTIFVALQSAQVYWRRGDVDPALVSRLLTWTVVGSLGGVLTVHLGGWAEAARVAMGVVLVAVAARFSIDVWRARKRAPAP